MKNKQMKGKNRVVLMLLLAFLGVSPIGEPHLFGKIKWIAGGAVGMKPMDWFDFIMHGSAALISVLLLFWMAYSFLIKSRS